VILIWIIAGVIYGLARATFLLVDLCLDDLSLYLISFSSSRLHILIWICDAYPEVGIIRPSGFMCACVRGDRDNLRADLCLDDHYPV